MTIIPISVTENPLMPAIVAQAGVDIWATLREQFGVTGKKARRRRT